MTEVLLIAASEQAGPRGTAKRMRNVAAGAADAALGERIEIRRRNVLATKASALPPAEVIRIKDDQIRLIGGVRCREAKKRQNAEHADEPLC